MDVFNHMKQNIQQIHQAVASYTGKLLRDHFGKGPESVSASIGNRFIVLYFRNFLTPTERVLMEQGHELIVSQTREKLIQTIIPELTGYIELVTGVKPTSFYYDWGLHNKSGMLVGVSDKPFPGAAGIDESYPGKAEIEQEVIHISRLAQKAPELISSCMIHPKAILVIREGILVRIEKELIRLGHGEMLKTVKRGLEKSYLHNSGAFEKALGVQVADVFADWDLDRDQSVILIMTK